ncbi:MAG: lamin tail domain-containing protein [Limisphaerales bacterium]
MAAVAFLLTAVGRLSAQVVISEFMAAGQRQLADEDGDYEDWIELFNVGHESVDLTDWALTDNPDRPTKWRFPAVSLDPGRFLVVFASEKDRRSPGQTLHTNFKLGATGEYLALLEPDRRTVSTAFVPDFPPQVTGISYGLPIHSGIFPLVPRGAPGRFHVPIDDRDAAAWLAVGFPDSTWTPVTSGIGFDTQPSPVLVPVADSVEDWSPQGVQGHRGWVYGYYDKSKDALPGFVPGDFTPFPRSESNHSPANHWNGTSYRWPAATSPWDLIGQSEGHPNGTASGGEHWVIRRWSSSVAGDLQVRWRLAKSMAGGAGVTARLFHNGTQRDVLTIAGGEVTGVTRTAELPGVAVGDFISLALTPIGVGGATDDRSDAAHFSMTILAPGTLDNLIGTDVGAAMHGANASAYLRLPFVLTNVAEVARLNLRVRYDDGFVAWLNGAEVARRNAPTGSAGKAIADSAQDWSPEGAQGVDGWYYGYFDQEFDLTAYRDFLQPGTNLLCLQGLNETATDTEFLLVPELTAERVILDLGGRGYFATPTPGEVNGPASEMIGPVISEVIHTPKEPGDAEDLVVEARITPTLRPVGTVTLRYRVMYGAESAAAMRDDGTAGDAQAGDGRYTGVIPAGASRRGQMVRYAIVAADVADHEMRLPEFFDPRNSPQYFGTVVADPSLASSTLPVLHWFIERPGAADSDTPARCSLHFAGRFYDNTAATLHGQSTRGFPKKSYDFDLNPGHNFRWSDDAPGVDDFNLLTTWADKTHLRTVLAYETYRNAGVPAHFAFAVRVQQNGNFFSVANFVENGDDNFLQRLGFDENGALYKMYNSAESVGGNEKKTRKFEGTADLQALISGMSQAGSTARQNYMFDHLDLPEIVNFLATRTLTADTDCCHKNYYFYRDTLGTGEWQAMPWDVDLSFGRVWTCGSPCLAYFDETIYTNQSIYVGSGNTVLTPVFNTPATRQMYLRRLRTLMDRWLQPPGTPITNDFYRHRSLALHDEIVPDAALDLARWGTWGRRETISQALDRIWNEFLPGRRQHLFRNLSVTNRGDIPLPQAPDVTVRFGALEFRPASGIPDQEWLALRNNDSNAVDLSEWRLEGGVRFTFKGGTVIPAQSDLYVSPNVKAFRSRTLSPKGGERRLVVGPYSGNLSAWGESLQLLDPTGRLVARHTFPGEPSPAQQYLRITELMFHPAPAAGGAFADEEFEYLELRNLGPVSLDLRGVAFTAGVQFAFSTGTVTNLAPMARVIVVKNAAAFAARYGSGLPVAGEYAGSLDNAGERLRLEDGFGEKILDFEYHPGWQPLADGPGFSLAVTDEQAPWEDWGNPDQWRLDGVTGGSPGAANPPPPGFAPIVISELLAHTDPPQEDAIELHNPTGQPVDMGGWWLTDDLGEPRKFRLPPATVLPPGGQVAFTETQFNGPGAASGFRLGSEGDDVWLLSGDAFSNLTGYLQGLRFGPTENGVSLGRWVNSAGEIDYVPLSALTLGHPNALPRVGPVVLSEIMYHPPAWTTNDPPSSYVELANLGSQDTPLFNPAEPDHRWRLAQAVDFEFPRSTRLPPAGRVLVVGFDPTVEASTLLAFRHRYGLPDDVPILGPWQGRLGNADETIELLKPDTAGTNGVPYVLVERVHYLDHAPWPAEADGLGASLQRLRLDGYANEPTNWFASAPTPGAPNVPNRRPTLALTSPLPDAVLDSPAHVRLVVEAADSDGRILRVEFWADDVQLGADPEPPYEWMWNDVPPGVHQLTARAVDDRFATATVSVTITVLAPGPTVRIVSPARHTVTRTGSTLKITAEASQPGGTIQQVQLRVGNTRLAEFLAPPYTFAWSNSTAGVYPLTAVATAQDGHSATSTVVSVAFTRGALSNVVLVPKGAPWRYLDDGSDQGTAWRATDFNDGAWRSGLAELGYGDASDGRTETTIIGYGPEANAKHITTWFRHRFEVTGAGEFADLTVHLLRDDGAIVHLNGNEVFRSNLPETGINHLTPAVTAAAGVEETTFFPQAVPTIRLREGTNTLAVEVHQNAGTSSDLSFDLELTGTRVTLAPIVLESPGDRIAQANGETTFAIQAGGSEPLSFQWYLNGAAIPDARERSLRLTQLSAADSGAYSVRIQNRLDFAVSSPATLIVNRPPIPGLDGATTSINQPLELPAARLLINDTDPEGDPLQIVSVNLPSAGAGSVSMAGGRVTYRPAQNFEGTARFDYVLADGRGGEATGTVEVNVIAGTVPLTATLSVEPEAGYRLRFAGDPGQTWELQRSTDLVNWIRLETKSIPLHGLIEFEAVPTPTRHAFYRTLRR